MIPDHILGAIHNLSISLDGREDDTVNLKLIKNFLDSMAIRKEHEVKGLDFSNVLLLKYPIWEIKSLRLPDRWRLPTRWELLMLIDKEVIVHDITLWTDTTYKPEPSCYVTVNPSDGTVGYSEPSNKHSVILVR